MNIIFSILFIMLLEECENKPSRQVQKHADRVSSHLSNVWKIAQAIKRSDNHIMQLKTYYVTKFIKCLKIAQTIKDLYNHINWNCGWGRYLKNSGPHSQLVALDMQCLETIGIKDDTGGCGSEEDIGYGIYVLICLR